MNTISLASAIFVASKNLKQRTVDWDQRKGMLDELVAEYRGKYDYDCILPFSGGKDSTFTLYYLVKEYKLKPLVVQFNHGFMRPNLLANNERTFKSLGVDVISFTPNWKVVKAFDARGANQKRRFLLALPYRDFLLSDAYRHQIQRAISILGRAIKRVHCLLRLP